jgi:hypothetical protein
MVSGFIAARLAQGGGGALPAMRLRGKDEAVRVFTLP